MKKIAMTVLVLVAAGCIQMQPGADRAPAPLRPIGEAGARDSSILVFGSYQRRYGSPSGKVAAATAKVLRGMQVQVLSETDTRFVGQFSNGTKLYVTLEAQTPDITLVDARVDPTNETICLEVLRRIDEGL